MKKLSFLLILAMSVTFAMAQNGRTLYDFEDSTTQGWTTIDADGDGYNWELASVLMAGYNIPSHGDGADCMSSQSYDNDSGSALTPDNYLVSPLVQLGGSITFWAQAQDANYASEHFGLAVSTTSNTNPSAFTTIQEWTMTAKSTGAPTNFNRMGGNRDSGAWYEYTVDLSAYSGQGYLAIRHFNCTDWFYLNVDDITISEEGGGGGGGSESVIYDFEDSTTQGWTTIDADGDGFTWVLGSAIGGIYLVDGASLAGSGHNSSNDLMCSGSYRNTSSSSGEALTPDNYLVSPQVTLGGSISFWACGQDANYVAEHFGVAVSTTNNSSASAFTTIQEWTLSSKGVGAPTQYTRSGNRDQGVWQEFTVDLSAYSGQGYIAIRHFNCSDEFILNIDDINIVEDSGGSGQTTYTITATPNPLEGGYITIAYRGERDRQSYDFEDGAQGWTSIDADGDGYGWDSHINTGTGNHTAHAGDGLMTSASYINDIGALTPDNYLVSPQVQLGGSITFYACAQDASYAAEHFGVAVSTTSNTNASAFTTLQEWTMTAKNGGVPTNYTRSGNGMSRAYYEYTVDLSAYAGQTGYVAIRHFDCTDQFYLNVDDITINEGGSGGQTGETVTGEFNEGQTCILTAIPFTGYHFVNWTENGTVVSTNAVYSFTVTGNRTLIANFSNESGQTYTITATPDPLEGGYVTIAYRGDRTVVFSDDFENGIANWTTIDADGDGYTWYDLIDDNPNNIPGHNGSAGFATSASYQSVALTPDNYLVSPQLALNGTFSFWACAQDNSWAEEHFGVAISTTNNTSASAFTTIQEWTLSAKSGSGVLTSDTRDGMTRDQGNWYQYTVDLSSYAGQMGYIAIRHFDCTDMFRIVVDDVELTTNDGGQTGETVSATFDEGQTCILSAFPFTGYHFVNWTENGTVVSTESVYSFTVTSNRDLVAHFSNAPAQTYTITATPNPLEGGYITIEYSGDREEFFYDFEDNTTQGWTTIDADGDGFNWELGSVLMAGYLIPSHGDGADCMSSQSYDSDAGALTPDNYLVSPQVQLGGSITFWACAQDESYAAEHFGVAVSTTNNTSASAFTTLQEWTMSAKGAGNTGNYATRSRVGREGTWYEYTVDLSDYAGQTGYIAIRHFNCSDMFYLDVDDITIVEGTGGDIPETGETVSAVFEEGQTCILTAHPFSGYYFVNWTENGAEVSNTAVYSFPVDRDRNLVANFSQQPAENYTINAVADPAAGGTVTGTGTYAYGTEITLGVMLNEGYIFQYWTEGGLIVSYDQNYTFTVTGNRDLVACLKLDEDGVGEHTINVAIYPNPVSDKLNVEASETIDQVEVFNINGAKVFSQKNYTEKAEINTADLPAGTYVIRMTTKNACEVRSFVKF